MSVLTPAAFQKILGAKSFVRKPLYLLFGSEPKRLLDASNRLKDRLVADLGEENYFRYSQLGPGPEEQAGNDVVAQLNTVSMFGGGKLALIGPLPSLLKADEGAFNSYAASPNPSSTLILAVNTKKGDKRALSSFSRSAIVKAFGGADALVVSFGPQKTEEVKKWVALRFHARGVTIAGEATHRLIERTDNNLDRLANEVDKLLSYIGDRTEVTLDDIEFTVGDHKSDDVWGLLKGIRRRDLAHSVASLNNLMDQQNLPAQMLLKMITTELMRLFAAQELQKRGGAFDAFAAEMGGAPFMLKEPFADARNWSEPLLRRGLNAVLKTNTEIMLAPTSPAAAMTSLLTTLCRT